MTQLPVLGAIYLLLGGDVRGASKNEDSLHHNTDTLWTPRPSCPPQRLRLPLPGSPLPLGTCWCPWEGCCGGAAAVSGTAVGCAPRPPRCCATRVCSSAAAVCSSMTWRFSSCGAPLQRPCPCTGNHSPLVWRPTTTRFRLWVPAGGQAGGALAKGWAGRPLPCHLHHLCHLLWKMTGVAQSQSHLSRCSAVPRQMTSVKGSLRIATPWAAAWKVAWGPHSAASASRGRNRWDPSPLFLFAYLPCAVSSRRTVSFQGSSVMFHVVEFAQKVSGAWWSLFCIFLPYVRFHPKIPSASLEGKIRKLEGMKWRNLVVHSRLLPRHPCIWFVVSDISPDCLQFQIQLLRSLIVCGDLVLTAYVCFFTLRWSPPILYWHPWQCILVTEEQVERVCKFMKIIQFAKTLLVRLKFF